MSVLKTLFKPQSKLTCCSHSIVHKKERKGLFNLPKWTCRRPVGDDDLTKKTILIDVASAGASGDMFLSALIDLMSDDDALVPLAASLLIFDPTIRVKVLPRESGDQKGRQLEVTVDESVRFTPKSLREMLGAVCEEVEASKAARTLANNILETLSFHIPWIFVFCCSYVSSSVYIKSPRY